jgi:hypothetical protein
MAWYSSKRSTTVLPHDGGRTSCIYHQTKVVSWNDSTVVLNSGGHRTLTTKTRMNQCAREYGLGYSVYQKNRVWYVDFAGKTIPFQDDMVLERP